MIDPIQQLQGAITMRQVAEAGGVMWLSGWKARDGVPTKPLKMSRHLQQSVKLQVTEDGAAAEEDRYSLGTLSGKPYEGQVMFGLSLWPNAAPVAWMTDGHCHDLETGDELAANAIRLRVNPS